MAKKAKAKKKAARKPVAKAKARKPAAKKTGHDSMSALNGWITHTEFASTDPRAMKTWCSKVLGWKFRPSFPMPDGEYILFTYSDKGGGGIRSVSRPDEASTVPYVQVANVKATFDKAIRAGAEVMMAPEKILDDLVIAVVRAPGGVAIGLAGPK